MPLRRAVCAATLATLIVTVGCGARTGLVTPGDAGPEPPPEPPCVPGRFALERRDTEVVLVLDRSGSMQLDFDGHRARAPLRRWDVLHFVLAETLPALDGEVALGVFAFPRERDASTDESTCTLDEDAWVAPHPGGAAAVLRTFATDPAGPTPTAAALASVGDRLAERVSLTRAAAIVLATDGGPNCNEALDPATCACTGLSTADCAGSPRTCLDDERTVETIRARAERGVPTYVVGLDGTALDFERAALEHMALAGGRARLREGARAYYAATEPDDLREAFAEVHSSIACVRATPSRPSDPDAIVVELGGEPIARDPTHVDGWDWAPFELGQIELFGSACARLREGDVAVGVEVTECAAP